MGYRRGLIVFFFLCAFFVSAVLPTYAQGGAAGIALEPATIEQLATTGETINETLTITNLNSQEKQYFLYIKDIKGVDSGGTPIFADPNAPQTGFEVSSWVHLDKTSYTLGPNQQLSIPVQIAVPENASPGSHFGGIFASVEPPKIREIGAGVGYEVASIISIRIKGKVNDSARVRSFYTDKLLYGSKNVNFTAAIENQGNILIRPRGPLTITGMFGGKPEVITVNNDQAGVFPGATRELKFSWHGDGLGFGRYKAVLALLYDGNGGQRTIDATTIFWVFPMKVIIPAAIALGIILLLGYFGTRMYVRSAVMRAAGSRKIAPQRYRKQVGISRGLFVTISILVVVLLFLIVVLLVFA
jgi:hypothetical protein